MRETASRVHFRKRVNALHRSPVVRLVCLLVLTGVVLAVAAHIVLHPCRHHVRPQSPAFDIPYRSNASVYRRNARYVTQLPHRKLDAGEGADVSDAASPPPPPSQLPRAAQTRAQRQDALEEEIENYLVAHGIHRERRLRVRFHIVSNFFDWRLCTTLGAAALGGMSYTVSGLDVPYSHLGRYRKYLEYAELEGLDEDDIMVTMDGDIFWTGADFAPFLSKFSRFSPETEADLDVAAVRAWEDYGEKKAPLFMKELQAQANDTGRGTAVERTMQMAPLITTGEHVCWWGQHSKGFVECSVAFTVMDHLIGVARNHVSSYGMPPEKKAGTAIDDGLRAEITNMFPEASRWAVDDMLHQPNASSPYTTKAPRDRSDPFFYHPFTVNRSNPTGLLNSGLQVSRVWALRRLVNMMDVFRQAEKPVPEGRYHKDTEWKCDQGTIGELYTRARLFEVEHNLLSGPPLSTRTPPVQYDPRFGPPGLIGLDRRTEMVVLGSTVYLYPSLLHHSAYMNQHFSVRDWSGLNVTDARLGSSDPKRERLGALTETRGGALVTPPLLWRSATGEDQRRGYKNIAEDDPDVVRPAFLHYAGPNKHGLFVNQRYLFSWLVAARHSRRARQAFNQTLHKELVELWYEKERVYVDYLRMCQDPTEIPSA